MTTRVWGKPFQNHHQESSHNLLQMTDCALTSILWTPRSSNNSWPAQLTCFDQEKHTHKHSNGKKPRVHKQLIPLTQNWKLSKKDIVQGIPLRSYCIWNTLPRALAWHSQIFVFPWGIYPRTTAFKRADFLDQQFLEATLAHFGLCLVGGLFLLFFSPKELIVNCLKISLERLRGESNGSFWQLYYSSVCALWPHCSWLGHWGWGKTYFMGQETSCSHWAAQTHLVIKQPREAATHCTW